MFTQVSGGVHISNRTINWPMTGGVHLFAGRVMALSLVDNSARVVVGCTNTHTHACMQANPNPGLNHSHKHMVDTGRQLGQRGPLRLAPLPPHLIIASADSFSTSSTLPLDSLVAHVRTRRIFPHGLPQAPFSACNLLRRFFIQQIYISGLIMY